MSNPRPRFVEWTNDFCTLRFKTPQPEGEALDLRLIERIRQPITRSKRTFRAKVPDAGHASRQHCESLNEMKAVIVLIVCAHADILKMQPFRMTYNLNGKIRRYTPDVLLVWGEELWAIEIKEDEKAEREKAEFELIGSLLATHRIHFKLWKKSEFCIEPRLATARFLIRYQKCPVSAIDKERLRIRFAETPAVAIGELDDNDIRSILRLVIHGQFFVDWSSSLNRMSWVSASPIGEQLWPACPQDAQSV